MYVRWKRRALPEVPWLTQYTKTIPVPIPGREGLYAVLVEARRVDGKPRQRVIAHLGSIENTRLDNRHAQQYFWRQVRGRLDELGIMGDDRARIEAKLSATVPYPPDEEEERREAVRLSERFLG